MVIKRDYYLRIAGFTICLHFHAAQWVYPQREFRKALLHVLKGFLIEKQKTVDYSLCIKQRNGLDLLKEKKNFMRFYEKKKKRIITYYDMSVETITFLLCEILEELLPNRKGFFLHASASLFNDKAHIFLGNSGAGKSTITKLLKTNFPVIADDLVIIRMVRNNWLLFQVPMTEKNEIIRKSSLGYPIDGLFFLKKDIVCKVAQIKSVEQVLKKLIPQLYIEENNNSKQMMYVLHFIKDLKNCYIFQFIKGSNAVYEALKSRN